MFGTTEGRALRTSVSPETEDLIGLVRAYLK